MQFILYKLAFFIFLFISLFYLYLFIFAAHHFVNMPAAVLRRFPIVLIMCPVFV